MAKRDIYNRSQRARRGRKSGQISQISGTPLPSNAGVAAAYAGELAKLTSAMAAATRKTVKALAGGGADGFMLSSQGQIALGSLETRFSALFEAKARDMADAMLAASLKAGSNNLSVSLKAMAREAGQNTMGTVGAAPYQPEAGAVAPLERSAAGRGASPRDMEPQREAAKETGREKSLKELSRQVTLKADFSPDMKAGLREAVEENVRLIKSIPARYYGKIQEATLKSVTEGQGLKDLIPQIERIGRVTRERARFIAVDQTRKANAFICGQKMRDAGIRKFRWRHSAGSEVPRPQHAAPWQEGDEHGIGGLNGGIFSLDKPPVIDLNTGERGFPGQLINCRCSMEPVLD